jgi:hypothetical protein
MAITHRFATELLYGAQFDPARGIDSHKNYLVHRAINRRRNGVTQLR